MTLKEWVENKKGKFEDAVMNGIFDILYSRFYPKPYVYNNTKYLPTPKQVTPSGNFYRINHGKMSDTLCKYGILVDKNDPNNADIKSANGLVYDYLMEDGKYAYYGCGNWIYVRDINTKELNLVTEENYQEYYDSLEFLLDYCDLENREIGIWINGVQE